MNGLSWTIYAADVAANISGALIGVFSIGLLAMVAWAFFGFMANSIEDEPELLNSWKRNAKKMIGCLLAIIAVASVIPSRNSIMMIAASEFGERVITSKQVSDIANPATDLLKTWIENELARLKKKES